MKGSWYLVEELKVYEFCVGHCVFYLMAIFFVPSIGLHVYGVSYMCHMWGLICFWHVFYICFWRSSALCLMCNLWLVSSACLCLYHICVFYGASILSLLLSSILLMSCVLLFLHVLVFLCNVLCVLLGSWVIGFFHLVFYLVFLMCPPWVFSLLGVNYVRQMIFVCFMSIFGL